MSLIKDNLNKKPSKRDRRILHVRTRKPQSYLKPLQKSRKPGKSVKWKMICVVNKRRNSKKLSKQRKRRFVTRAWWRLTKRLIRRRETRRRKMLDLPRNSKRSDCNDSIKMPMPPWLRRRPGKSWRLELRDKLETARTTDSSTNASSTASRSKIKTFGQIIRKTRSQKSCSTTKATRRGSQ